MTSDLLVLPRIESLKFVRMSFRHRGHLPILVNCDFDFPCGAFVRIKSNEGGGKSSLMQILAGLMMPTAGQYLINDIDVVQMTFEEFLPFRLCIGFGFDYGGLISNRTIKDNLLLPLIYHKLISDEEARARVQDLIRRFEMERYANERPAHVPGRVRKLATLLRAVVIYPQLLLLDDPSIGLSEATQGTLISYIHELREQGFLRHIFISSYDETFMSLFDHTVIHLDAGQLYEKPIGLLKKAANL